MILILVLSFAVFISMGLPNSILGSAWPIMYQKLNVPVNSAGIISMLISGGTIISGFTSVRLIRRFGTGRVIAASKILTALSLIGFAVSGHFWLLTLLAIPLGLGAGAIDTGLNGFVALHYKARHMNWLHSFWAVGAALGPVIMALSLKRWHTWESGYLAIAFIQLVMFVVLLIALPLWRRAAEVPSQNGITEHHILPLRQLIRLPGAKQTLIALFGICGIEASVGLWGSTFLVLVRNIPEETAVGWITLYFSGIMVGRFLSGFLSIVLSDRQLIQYGQVLIAIGIGMLFFTLSNGLLLTALFLVGLGIAPIVPSMLHSTPAHFGSRFSQSIMGVQMASVFAGSAFVPPLFGLIAQEKYYGLFPHFLAVILVLMFFTVNMLYRSVQGREGLLEPQDEVSTSG